MNLYLKVPNIFSVTNLSFSKQNTFCGERDIRISFSKPWTYAQSLVSIICLVVVSCVTATAYDPSPGDSVYIYCILVIPPLVGQITGVIFTTFLVFFNKFRSCCECCRGEEETMVYNPDNPQSNLVIKHGKIVDMDQRDETEKTDDEESEL